MYPMAYGYYDSGLLIAILAVFVLGLIAQARVKSTFNKFAQVQASARLPAHVVAQQLLDRGGSSVRLTQVGGSLTDHYNPKAGEVGLSTSVYGSESVGALAVAAHEIGHVMQYQEGYLPIRVRNAILPVASIGSSAAPWITLLGVLFGQYSLAMVGVWLFLGILLFQFITLPVELDASHRGIAMLEEGGYITVQERRGARSVLNAAAMTYVVAALSALVSFLRLFLMARSTRRNR